MIETFTNEYGEKWWFTYDAENKIGILTGDDDLIMGQTFYVLNGICPSLILDRAEREWLKEVWNKFNKNINNYLNLDTEIKDNNKNVYLTNNYCPICLNQKDSFEDHHCIPASEGGSDDYVNILRTCNSCHSLITNGCEEERISRYLCAINHQLSIFGIKFILMNPLNNKRYKNRDMGLYIYRPYYKETIDLYNKLKENEKLEFNEALKKESVYWYKYYRNVVKNIIPYNNPLSESI